MIEGHEGISVTLLFGRALVRTFRKFSPLPFTEPRPFSEGTGLLVLWKKQRFRRDFHPLPVNASALGEPVRSLGQSRAFSAQARQKTFFSLFSKNMSAFPITFVISACLLAIFVIYFARTHSGERKRGVDQESLLPLEEETPKVVGRYKTQERSNAAKSQAHKDE